MIDIEMKKRTCYFFFQPFYNFVRPHGTLCKINNYSNQLHAPAITVGLSNHAWTLEELMTVYVMQ